MSGKNKPETPGTPKFGLMDRLKKPAQESAPVALPRQVQVADEPEVGDVKFTSYIDADLNRRLQIYVATKKAQKRRGEERVSIKSVLDQAIREFLEHHGG